MDVHDHRTIAQLRDLARSHARVHRTWVRYQAVLLARAGRTAPDIAVTPGCSRRAVQPWVARSNEGGPDALQERPHPGRPPRMPADGLERLEARLAEPPRPGPGTASARPAAPTSAASSSRTSASD